ncbi:hypothetical protein HALLA_15180 [Halostagnicola larsenii XH-48]|uniref:Uncharacterized protein n=1 Tax=Halostagnicola larsenii XH-48 TaxID=797299 RepID=W0JUP4_9EURY|nr:hypothetical protein HALLA_15180 [Halostagnicola larsenii XH-48]
MLSLTAIYGLNTGDSSRRVTAADSLEADAGARQETTRR